MNTAQSQPLLERYPRLVPAFPRVPLGSFPTPVERLSAFGTLIDVAGLWVKRDDMSAKLYGGNKVRKLEFLLGAALAEGRSGVLTFGGAGSNHALATAIYAGAHGLRAISVLFDQPNTPSVARNLLLSYQVGAELHYVADPSLLEGAATELLAAAEAHEGSSLMTIPLGGSSPLGTVGFVNAAFELAVQVEAGLLPEPDVIYVAAGTMGTLAGLALGCRAAGLGSRVVGVRVTPEAAANERALAVLIEETAALLRSPAPDFPLPDPGAMADHLEHAYFGGGYARPTAQGADAVRRAGEVGLKLEGTYTGKAFAALLEHAEEGRLSGKNVLFWNTYNSRDFSDRVAATDYRRLPQAFHRYFEEPVVDGYAVAGGDTTR
ncbi:MAG: 1-aminocyclopropane-1-carboxylate deaminase/D-cysteine desulfhydrase [Thermoleophilia bacterium]